MGLTEPFAASSIMEVELTIPGGSFPQSFCSFPTCGYIYNNAVLVGLFGKITEIINVDVA